MSSEEDDCPSSLQTLTVQTLHLLNNLSFANLEERILRLFVFSSLLLASIELVGIMSVYFSHILKDSQFQWASTPS